jgi:16S rRNA (adenine1518-N6/adenine1519-N6)-dimethyltransferase
MRRLGVRPNRELGQNFLTDANILGVIGRAAELGAADDVLEIGGGLGVLSEFLAEQARHVHVVEVDAKLEPVLREALEPHANAELVLGDVMEIDLAGLEPRPNKVVSNLPYGVAVPALVRTIVELEEVELWVLMVQREIADRIAAAPGSKTYGIPSVVVQLSCEVEFLRPVSRTVFTPQPNVDSALIRLRRTGPGGSVALRSLVHDAFAHRRKALPRSLALARGSEEVRRAARAALQELGHPPDERAERLAPEEFEALAQKLDGVG